MSANNINKQRLDELLGIVTEMQKEPSPNFDDFMRKLPPDNVIPEDIPEEDAAREETLSEEAVNASRPSNSVNNILPQQQPTNPPVVKTQTPPKTNGSSAKSHSTAGMSLGVSTREPDSLELLDESTTNNTLKSLNEVDSLIAIAKSVISHVYGVVTSSDILDASTLSAAAGLIRETRALVEQHLEVQKSERDFLNKMQMEELKHQHQLQLMEKKFELEKMKYQTQHPPEVNTNVSSVQPNKQPTGSDGLRSYSSADMMRMLDQ